MALVTAEAPTSGEVGARPGPPEHRPPVRGPVALGRGLGGPRWRAVRSLRFQLLAAYVGSLALSLAVGVAVLHEVFVDRVADRVDQELVQEAEEFSRLVGGNNPSTGQPFGDDARALFDTFFERNVPSQREGFFALVDGQPYITSPFPPAQLTTHPELVDDLVGLVESRRGRLATDAGPAEYLAVPVRVLGADGAPVNRAVFLVAVFPEQELQEVNDQVRITVLVLLAVLALASCIAWASAGHVLAPLRRTIDTARAFEETDLSRRVPVRGRGEVGELGRTFNGMLDRLERAFSTQRDFVSDAGHELRTPITIVRGHLELMGDDPDERRETVALVTDELDRMSRLVDDLLLLAKSERPDFLRREPVEVAELLPAVLAKASALAERDWRLESTTPAVVDGDRQRLTQAFMQLAANASQHTPPGAVIALGAGTRRDPGTGAEEVRLWVRDEGEGITPVDQARIFERFARGSTGPRRSEGSGLGLAIVRAIAVAHGGGVELESSRGAGSTFTVVLPAWSADAEAT